MTKYTGYFLLCICLILLAGCESDMEHSDLKQYVAELKSMPKKGILPFPKMQTYQTFTYEASGLRSPFKEPATSIMQSNIYSNVKPSLTRKKHSLEKFSFDAFTLVGILKKTSVTKGLVKVDNDIYLVSKGDYLGRNHGRVVRILEKEIQVMELVPAGMHSWIERPRRLILE